MQKRYQVFVSSTYDDLREERKAVMQGLLELDCFPAAMELFSAADSDQWTLIKKVIDDSDYYVVVVGGRYGSLGPDGMSYTEMEYRYALEQRKPIIGFVHADPGQIPSAKTEQSAEGRDKLQLFKELVLKKLCRRWSSPADLQSGVIVGVLHLMRNNPAVGWVKATPSGEVNAEELIKYRRRIDELEALLLASAPPPFPIEDLSQGDELCELRYNFQSARVGQGASSHDSTVMLTWNTIFAVVGPDLLNGTTESVLKASIGSRIKQEVEADLKSQRNFRDVSLFNFTVHQEDFYTVVYQFRSLGLIVIATEGVIRRWKLTPQGDQLLAYIKAVRRKVK
ncbi:DUF4062 domain-containing protein [Duganella phyllosphaerae]|uniref:DUF4062 domain-containing protein n=1 Tax=Duganella phyllosphaerae TaxID=762836 RepID=A0A1E7X6Q4_9BURK|nr:DUF4062 domain-containing protein [Duganella phyllosphaerae]OFA08807.1 hypothetical protein DUPY_04830 [Duganella phyllosphaerae]